MELKSDQVCVGPESDLRFLNAEGDRGTSVHRPGLGSGSVGQVLAVRVPEPQTKQAVAAKVCDLRAGGAETGDFLVSCPVSLMYLVSSRFSESLSQKVRWRQLRKTDISVCSPRAHTHMLMHSHAHLCTPIQTCAYILHRHASPCAPY